MATVNVLITAFLFVSGAYTAYFSATKIVALWHARKGPMPWWVISLYVLFGGPVSWMLGFGAGMALGFGLLYGADLIWGDQLTQVLHMGETAATIIGKSFAFAAYATLAGIAVGIYRATQYTPEPTSSPSNPSRTSSYDA